MKYLDLVKELQNEKINEGHIVVIENGIFIEDIIERRKFNERKK